jgi:hopanoid biosynthesis associated radical SAM protein HpnH
VFQGQPPAELHRFFDQVMALGVDGMVISPGYRYQNAPKQDLFLGREEIRKLFRAVLAPLREGQKQWVFSASPLFLEFLEGKIDYECTPWGSPNYSVLGWQRPCYLMSDGGYVETFRELMEDTDWTRYGTGRHPKCAQCMMSCGYEPTAVMDSVSSLPKMLHALKASR